MLLSKEQLQERLHYIARKRIVIFRGIRIRRLMLRLSALEGKCSCCK